MKILFRKTSYKLIDSFNCLDLKFLTFFVRFMNVKTFHFFKNSCELVFGDIRLYTFFKQLNKSNDSNVKYFQNFQY